MADLPIIFSQNMINALLAGQKTQTRLLFKLPKDPSQWEPTTFGGSGPAWAPTGIWNTTTGKCIDSKWQLGDRLWVREAWRTTDSLDKYNAAEIGRQCVKAGYLGPWAPVLYLADKTAMNWVDDSADGRVRAAIYMPRWLSRLTLIVTAVKIERLQDITEADARAEGVLYVRGHGEITRAELRADPGYSNFINCRQGFEVLWNKIHGPGAWGSNPWVVAISFERADG